MPPSKPLGREKSLQSIADGVGLYPTEAYEFLQQGLAFTVHKIHGNSSRKSESRHVSGRELCEGLREFALLRWGLMARTVLARWSIRRTMDFGRIVFALVENGLMQTTEDDCVEDFRDVYDFKTAFESEYRIEKVV